MDSWNSAIFAIADHDKDAKMLLSFRQMSRNYGILPPQIGDLVDQVLQGDENAIEVLADALEVSGQSAHVSAVRRIRMEKLE